jgi:cAMP phosphodiesterase
MRVQILGAHQGESRDMRFISILVDGSLAVDAGSLTSSLTLEEQLAIQAVLITHRHFDHIKDLPLLHHNTWETKPLQLYTTADTRDSLVDHIFNGIIWPDMRKTSNGLNPLVFNVIKPGKPFNVLGYEALAIPMPHSVPTVGYLVKHGGKSFFYTADTRGEDEPPWGALKPDLLITETTLSNRYDEQAARFGHMTPLSLGKELRACHEKYGYYPRTICVHINPNHERLVLEELKALADELGADIQPAHEGMVVDL